MKNIQLCLEGGRLLNDSKKYKELIGKLLYLNLSRRDISYAVQELSQCIYSPTDLHWKSALHVLKYLKGCPSKGLFFEKNLENINITTYSDSN